MVHPKGTRKDFDSVFFQDVAQHIRDEHFLENEEHRFKCLECSSGFIFEQELIHHRKNEHGGDATEQFLCKDCSLTVYGNNYNHMHQHMHQQVKEIFRHVACFMSSLHLSDLSVNSE